MVSKVEGETVAWDKGTRGGHKNAPTVELLFTGEFQTRLLGGDRLAPAGR